MTHQSPRIVRLTAQAIIVLWISLVALPVEAQEGVVSVTPPQSAAAVSLKSVTAQIDALETSTSEPQEVRDAALELYRAAQSQLRLASEYSEAAGEFSTVINTGSDQLKELIAIFKLS